MHALVRVQAVAVLDGVDQRFFEGQLDGEDVSFGEGGSYQRGFDIRLNEPRMPKL